MVSFGTDPLTSLGLISLCKMVREKIISNQFANSLSPIFMMLCVFSQASASAASHDIGCSSAAHSKPVTHLELTRFFPQSQTFLGLTHLAECSVLDMGPEPSIKRDLNHGSRTLEAGRV